MVNICQIIIFTDPVLNFFYRRVFKLNYLIAQSADEMIVHLSADLCFISGPVTFKIVFSKDAALAHKFQSLVNSCSGNIYVVILHLKI